MAMIGKPFQGIIYYEVETSYGNGIVGGSEKAVGEFVQDVRIGTGDRHAVLRGFDSPIVKDLLKQTHEPSLHIEYLLQVGDNLLEDMERDACCELNSLAFAIGVNTCDSNASDEASWFEVKGCKPNTISIAASKNEPYTITVDYEAKSIATDDGDGQPGSTPAEIGGAVCAFNIAGAITKDGGAIAYICNSINITIENNLTGYTDHDSLYKDYLIEGEMNATGSVDITMDNGGGVHIGEVLANTGWALQVQTGGAGAIQIDLAGCEWDNGEIDQNISGEAVMRDVPFTAVPSECSQIFSTV